MKNTTQRTDGTFMSSHCQASGFTVFSMSRPRSRHGEYDIGTEKNPGMLKIFWGRRDALTSTKKRAYHSVLPHIQSDRLTVDSLSPSVLVQRNKNLPKICCVSIFPHLKSLPAIVQSIKHYVSDRYWKAPFKFCKNFRLCGSRIFYFFDRLTPILLDNFSSLSFVTYLFYDSWFNASL